MNTKRKHQKFQKQKPPQKKLKLSAVSFSNQKKNSNCYNKKIKGPDIPSSNLLSDKGKKLSRVSQTTSSTITSIPSLPLKKKEDSTKMLHRMSIPSNLRQVLDPDMDKLKRFALKKEKEKKQIRLAIQRGIIPDPVRQRMEEQKRLQQEVKPTKLYLDESGRTRDEKGNVMNLKQKGTQDLKVNINKAKEEKVKVMLQNQKSSGTYYAREKLFDQNV